MRAVAMRPGSTMLQVTPSRPTSRASVFDQPTSDSLSALEMPRLAIGATTPDEVEVMTRPHLRARMVGSTRSVIAMTESTIDWKLLSQRAGSPARRPASGWSAGVVDKHVEPAEFSFDAGDVRLDHRQIPEIPADGPGAAAGTGDRGGESPWRRLD